MSGSFSIKLFNFAIILLLICSPFIITNGKTAQFEGFQLIGTNDVRSSDYSYDSLPFLEFNVQRLDDRYFLWSLPQEVSSQEGYPVLFLFHGAAQHPFSWFIGLNTWSKAQTSFTRLALNLGFIVIAPSSLRPIQPGPRAWDVFTKNISESKDLQLVENMLTWLGTMNTPIDWERIYCAGFSSGGFMTSHIAHFFGDRFAGVIIHSGANAESITLTDNGPVFNCTMPYEFPVNHSPTLIVHGGADGFVPPECGTHYYNELIRCGFDATLLFDPSEGHIWLSEYNEDILSWIEREV